METITTERLIVRRASAADLQDFLAYQTHPINREYQPVEPMTEEAAAGFLARMAAIDLRRAVGWIMFAVELISEHRMIGEVGIYLEPPPQSTGDLGWSFHPDYHRQGYATEAARVLLKYAFQERGLQRVTSTCDARNKGSIRLMERLGMRHEGNRQQSQFLRGAWQDECLFSLSQSEWLSPASSS